MLLFRGRGEERSAVNDRSAGLAGGKDENVSNLDVRRSRSNIASDIGDIGGDERFDIGINGLCAFRGIESDNGELGFDEARPNGTNTDGGID